VQRNLLVDHLGFVMAIHRREFLEWNGFWERVGNNVGGDRARAQRQALGLQGESVERSYRAALTLYALTGSAVWKVLNREQRAIVSNTCRVTGVTFAQA
jgi:hypothetical protein